MNVVFYKRDLSDIRPVPSGVRVTVNSMRWRAMGGPSECSLTITGNRLGVWEMLEFLRCGVEVWNERGQMLWWGYVDEARAREGSLEIGVTMASTVNRVAVAYSYVEPGSNQVGTRRQTAWAEDADSIAEFGYRELISSAGGLSSTGATQRRSAILAARKFPQGVANASQGAGGARPMVSGSGYENSMSATLLCKGWWNTLSWRYASVPTKAAVSYTTTGAATQNVGSASGNQKVNQQVLISQGVRASQLSVYGKKVGSPADNLVLELYELTGGSKNPTGSALGSGSYAGSSMGTADAWVTVTLGSEVQISTSKLYGLVASRDGAVDGSNYYQLNVNEAAGYAAGALKIYNGSTWAARSPVADMPFSVRVDTLVETSEQIRDLATDWGEFITAVDMEVASGVYMRSYQKGDRITLDVILELMKSGGPNDRRLLGWVDADRRLRVTEDLGAPTTALSTYYMKKDGQVFGPDGREVAHWRAVGQWVRLQEVIPSTVDMSRYIDPSLQYVEGLRWSADSSQLTADRNGGKFYPEFRGQPSIDETLALVEKKG